MTTPPSLTVHAGITDRGVDVSLALGVGDTIAVLGPNGAGKSSLLSVIAGLLRPDRGRAVLGDEVLFDLDDTGSRRRWLPPYRRDTALLAQDALLFPHLSVLDNVAFGPRSRGLSRARSREHGRRWLAEVDAESLADRRPARLSGGQAQRVAIARALAAEPRLLLLDEPMAALDVTVAAELRQVLRRVLADQSVIIVTHDVLDALLLADRVVVLDGGRVVEDGPTRDVLTRPRSGFGAHIAGLNFAAGRLDGETLSTPEGLRLVGTVGRAAATGDVVGVFRPGAVSVHTERPVDTSVRNAWPTVITELEPLGSQVRVRSRLFSADVTATAVAELGLVPGREVWLAVKAGEVDIYPA